MNHTPTLLTPALWWALLAAWTLWWFNSRTNPRIPKKLGKHPRPGDLAGGGNEATSKVEGELRNALVKAGFRPLPQGTVLVTHRDHSGNRNRGQDGKGNHYYTPDVIITKPKRVIVELDPFYTHRGFDRIADDVFRNRHYAQLGYRVVRVRTGGAKALSPNDVVLERDYRPENDTGRIVRAIRNAKYLPARHWKNFAIRI